MNRRSQNQAEALHACIRQDPSADIPVAGDALLPVPGDLELPAPARLALTAGWNLAESLGLPLAAYAVGAPGRARGGHDRRDGDDMADRRRPEAADGQRPLRVRFGQAG